MLSWLQNYSPTQKARYHGTLKMISKREEMFLIGSQAAARAGNCSPR